MAKIVILMGRANSGKTKTIKTLAKALGLSHCYKKLMNWEGTAEEIYAQTNSLQESARVNLPEVVVQTSSIQEQNSAVLKGVLKAVDKWIKFLARNPDAVAIIPFTLTGGSAMRDLILQPLERFRKSGNEVKLVYLEKKNIKERVLVGGVVRDAHPNHTIPSKKNCEKEQAEELRKYLSLKQVAFSPS